MKIITKNAISQFRDDHCQNWTHDLLDISVYIHKHLQNFIKCNSTHIVLYMIYRMNIFPCQFLQLYNGSANFFCNGLIANVLFSLLGYVQSLSHSIFSFVVICFIGL